MNKKYFFLATLLSCTSLFGYIYRIELLQGTLPGRHPVNVFILFDVHRQHKYSTKQKEALIHAAQQLGIKITKVLIEDNGDYLGKNRIIREKIEKMRDEENEEEEKQFLLFLTEMCRTYNINASNIDDYRYYRFNKNTAREMVQELHKAQQEIAGYTDGPELQKIYQEHLAKDVGFNSKIGQDIQSTAHDYKQRETPLVELMSDRHIIRPLKRRGLLKQTASDTYEWNAPPLQARLLQAYKDARPADPYAQFAYNARLQQLAEERIKKADQFVTAAQKTITDAEEALDDCTTFAGANILEIKALHEIATMSPTQTNIIICVGGDHADALSTILTKKFAFKALLTRGHDHSYTEVTPVNIQQFFTHYRENILQKILDQFQATSPAMTTPDMRAHLATQLGSPVVGSSPVQRRLRSLRKPVAALSVSSVCTTTAREKRKATT